MPRGGCHCGYLVLIEPSVCLRTGERMPARLGDFHVCRGCGAPLIFAGDAWRPATVGEIFGADLEARILMARLGQAIAEGVQQLQAGAGGMVN